MAVFNYAKKEIDAKIVYYGPAISGKTTNLQYIHQHLKPDQRGKMVSLATNEDRTLFFDFLPIELESVRGFKTRFHLYTVPGQVYYGATRRAVLTGADGVVFVADSHADRMEDNLASLKDLEDNMRYYGKKVETTPLVIQYNKRDLPDVLSIEELNQKINRLNSPYIESVAILGKGVFETLTMACRLVLKAIENGVESRRSTTPVSDKVSPPTPPPMPAKSLRLEKGGASAETPPLRPGGVPGKTLAIEKEGRPPLPTQPAPETARPRPIWVEREGPGPEPLTPGKIAPVVGDRWEEEKKVVSPPILSRTPERKKPEVSLRFDRGSGKKVPLGIEKLRLLSCGQPKVSSPDSLDIPLTMEIEVAEKAYPLKINVSIKLEPID